MLQHGQLWEKPLQLPECQAAAPAGSNIMSTTFLYQTLDVCVYVSYVAYMGTPSLKQRLVSAANTDRLCTAMTGYCTHAFPSSRLQLQSTSSDADAPLVPVLDYSCVQSSFEQQLDHFNSSERRSWQQVYWVCDDAFPKTAQEQEESGVIYVFLGNESPLGTPRQPIVFENARRHRALVVLVEHRYYGASIPVPLSEDNTLAAADLQWLTMQQVIEDTAAVLRHVRADRSIPAAVPAVVLGGSYGGQLAAYHRLVKPAAFAAAVAASAPVTFVVGTQMWADTGDRYFSITADSADANSGAHSSDSGARSSDSSSSSCKGVLRAAVDQIGQLIKSPAGRREVAAAFYVCQPAQLTASLAAGQQFQWEVVEDFQWYAMSNNQPSNIGLMREYCGVLLAAGSAGADPMTALAEMTRYIKDDGSDDWCYDFTYSSAEDSPQQAADTAQKQVMVDVEAAYYYQCCTQGAVHGGILHSRGTAATFMPAKNASLTDFLQGCWQQFMADLPQLQPPWFMRDVARLSLEVGGLVFTGGSLDPWQGGAWASLEDVQATAASGGGRLITRKGHDDDDEAISSDAGTQQRSEHVAQYAGSAAAAGAASGQARLAFVVYEGASHCTDTHTYTWNQPGQPPAWKQQRAQAMDYAVQFAQQHRLRVRRSTAG
uniref:Serine carboxypeptidase S28-domain-containing protein n=1 Tax=Tetradesmus obliquus TaxID=3088 RepID=A0A383WGA6_TETOB|eukprot:jgi/Sobl393_1/19372/SZX76094.1